ncbi:MAG: tRNA (adenosine(37)-N6)-threonylcarbamoyltransferase complex ATPase subunit type 1 TsaE [Negativicoccus succinicivorans]|uniref:tRNA (adenosine(37)-N6)-threonylcarbamoyltransferase complex ATPase subunit type 1 TsaE n=1 Tax=Negativicoccus succinicivorans TaxID=620903 RepID=UPI0026ECF49B|nr:tRNA (adenosine(37)-N6)-threonylcarbamoyltransferase complex ATPase subunit type 1 TsaE [Negativicoccus succinicivorans]MBS6028064.1 tRNA (adenosine(37)-N6)-threonylcarbamoyltransferase complex ATPase subunit type 1 TsaE [Negativicoccus succinicivorans]
MKQQAVFITKGQEETRRLGAIFARHAYDGLYLALAGDLGAGKTQLAKGVAQGLGIAGEVASPTFTILHEYDTEPLAFHHFDLYRLESAAELSNIGFEEFGREGVTLVEWANKFLEELPRHAVQVQMHKQDEMTREIVVRAQDKKAQQWLEEVAADVARA